MFACYLQQEAVADPKRIKANDQVHDRWPGQTTMLQLHHCAHDFRSGGGQRHMEQLRGHGRLDDVSRARL